MSINLLEMMSGSIGQQLIGQAGKFLGESDGVMKSAVGAALPALLGGIAQKAAAPGGASTLSGLVNNPGLDLGMLSNLGGLLGNSDKTSGLMQLGQSMLGGVFGDKASGFSSALSGLSGMKPSSATSLLGLAVPMVIGFLKNHMTSNKMDVGGLVSLLGSQSGFLKNAIDSRLTGALGLDPLKMVSNAVGGASAAATTAVAATKGGMGRWLPWAILAAAAVFFLPQLRSCGADTTQKAADVTKAATQAAADAAKKTADAASSAASSVARAMKGFELPGGVKLDAPESGFLASLIAYLNGTDASLKSFTFDDLHFDTGSSALKAESAKQLEQLATVLKAFPKVVVHVEGHTDNTGDAAGNKKLSTERAATVEAALEKMGVNSDQITSDGFGQDKPIASNDTDAGRAQNRRVDLSITKR